MTTDGHVLRDAAKGIGVSPGCTGAGTARPLVAVVGPTGSGKSELALALAGEFAGEIVNCDSLQVFRHFDIGTAKLPEAEWRAIPHHLLSAADPGELFTAGEYARRARLVVEAIAARGHLPVIAGGTGFYLRALLDGLFDGPERDPGLRDRLAARQARRPASLHRLLARFDPRAAARIHQNDVPKTMRALEVCLLTRRPLTEAFARGRTPLQGFRTLKLGLLPDRGALNRRLDARCARMFESGLVEEVRGILALGWSGREKPFESHGYRQALALLRGQMTLAEAVADAQLGTRQYAKRQITWFRREPGLEWLPGFGDSTEVLHAARRLVAAFLTAPPPGSPPAGC